MGRCFKDFFNEVAAGVGPSDFEKVSVIWELLFRLRRGLLLDLINFVELSSFLLL